MKSDTSKWFFDCPSCRLSLYGFAAWCVHTYRHECVRVWGFS